MAFAEHYGGCGRLFLQASFRACLKLSSHADCGKDTSVASLRLLWTCSGTRKAFVVKCIGNYFIRACCAVCVTAITLAGTGLCASAQTASTDLSFEVATIKPVLMDGSHPFDPYHFWVHVYPERSSYWSMTLKSLVGYAYGVAPYQVTGSGWADADRFDIEAKFPDGAGKADEPRMLQALLKDRFKLTFHIEKRELESYVLVVGAHGEKLKASPPDAEKPGADAPLKPGDNNAGEGSPKSNITTNHDGSSTVNLGKGGTQTVKFDQETWSMHVEASKVTMRELAGRLSNCFGREMHKVEDQTGITGNYQVAYDCPTGTPPPAMSRDAADALPSDPQDGSLLTRSLDAMGLKLEKRKVQMDVYVIDHFDKPSEN